MKMNLTGDWWNTDECIILNWNINQQNVRNEKYGKEKNPIVGSISIEKNLTGILYYSRPYPSKKSENWGRT